MEREIIFRGKRVDNGEWVEGYYAKINTDRSIDVFYHEIFTGEMSSDNNGRVNFKRYIVKTETVGQYTGLKDKNGKRIFEGDIVICKIPEKITREVKFNYGSYWIDGLYPAAFILFANILSHCIEIIGNIHDNPELLEVQ